MICQLPPPIMTKPFLVLFEFLIQSSIFNILSVSSFSLSLPPPCFLSSSLFFSPLSSSSIQYHLLSSSSTASTPPASFSTATPPSKTPFSPSQTKPPFPSVVLSTLLKSPQGHPTRPTSSPSLPPSFSPSLLSKTASLAMGFPSCSHPLRASTE